MTIKQGPRSTAAAAAARKAVAISHSRRHEADDKCVRAWVCVCVSVDVPVYMCADYIVSWKLQFDLSITRNVLP